MRTCQYILLVAFAAYGWATMPPLSAAAKSMVLAPQAHLTVSIEVEALDEQTAEKGIAQLNGVVRSVLDRYGFTPTITLTRSSTRPNKEKGDTYYRVVTTGTVSTKAARLTTSANQNGNPSHPAEPRAQITINSFTFKESKNASLHRLYHTIDIEVVASS